MHFQVGSTDLQEPNDTVKSQARAFRFEFFILHELSPSPLSPML